MCLSQVIQQELHCKANLDQHLNCSLPLQNPLSRYGINEVMLNIIHHASQQLEEVLPCGSAKRKPLHEVPMAILYCLQTGNALLKDSKAMEINIRGPSTLEIHRIKVVVLRLVKLGEESSNLTHWIKNSGRAAANLKLRKWRHLNKSWTWRET